MKCNNYARGRCTTTQHIAVEALEESFLAQLQHDLTFAESVACVVQAAKPAHSDQRLQQQRARIVSRIDRLRDSYLDGIETLETYKAARQQMQAQLDDLDAQIAESAAVPVVDTAALLRNAIAAVLETLRSPTATVAQKYESAMSIIDRCTFDKSQMLLAISYKFIF